MELVAVSRIHLYSSIAEDKGAFILHLTSFSMDRGTWWAAVHGVSESDIAMC